MEKLHAGRRGKKNTPEHEAAVKASRIGTKHSEEAKKKMSDSRKNNPNKTALARAAGKACAEKRRNDPNYRLLQSQQSKAAWAKRKEGLVHGD